VATKIFEKQRQKYHKTYILHIVFLIIAIVYNVFFMIIISVNIWIDCLISVCCVKKIQAGTTPPQAQNIVQGS